MVWARADWREDGPRCCWLVGGSPVHLAGPGAAAKGPTAKGQAGLPLQGA